MSVSTADMIEFKVGDVVQLKSGGAPLTIVDIDFYKTHTVSCVSTGGLVQSFTCRALSLKHYNGVLTPATRKQ